MRTVAYTLSAARDLKRHGNVAGRVRKAVAEYAADPLAHANNVTQLVGSFWRKQRGLTQTALAGEIGVSQPYLAQIEGGHRVGDVVLYSKLAAALKVRIEDLVPDRAE